MKPSRFCHQSLCLVSLLANVASPAPANDISYVIEPFENLILPVVRNGSDQLRASASIASESLFGNGALHVPTTEEGSETIGWQLTGQKSYHCGGAQRLSIWYKLEEEDATELENLALRFILSDNYCGSSECEELDTFLTEEIPLNTTYRDWKEVSVEFDDSTWFSAIGDDSRTLDLHKIKEWYIEIIGDERPSILLDQFACIGDGTLLKSPFLSTQDDVEPEPLPNDDWDVVFFESPTSEKESMIVRHDGNIKADYFVDKSATWGGFVSMDFRAPANAYYNLSNSDSVAVNYQILNPASQADVAHFRVILEESSQCDANCTQDSDLEFYYSFNHILDNPASNSSRQFLIPLRGDAGSESPFFLPGWKGISGNMVLDREYIKGFEFEFNIGSTAPDNVTGSILVQDLMAFSGEPSANGLAAGMVEDTDVHFLSIDVFKLIEFKGGKCDEVCANDKDCLYASVSVQAPGHCYISQSINPFAVRLTSSRTEQLSRTFWKDEAYARGDFCDKCDCYKSIGLIDCRDKNLTMLPKTLSSSDSWSPLSLDLSGNPQLTYIGKGALSSEEWAISLEEVTLPSYLVYIEESNVLDLPNLRSVILEGDRKSTLLARNFLTSPNEAFEDICCVPGPTRNFGEQSISFCDVSLPNVGDDATYEPFYAIYGHVIKTLLPSSDFLAEAAESPNKCAEACDLTSGCRYYRYDGRLSEAMPSCRLINENEAGKELFCCSAGDYSDENRTTPGVTSGWAARTRHELGNARVFVEGTSVTVNARNSYQTEMKFELGSMPFRGAVWVTPSVVDEFRDNVVFRPQRVALFHNESAATISVQVLKPIEGTMVIFNKIDSCDKAFTSGSANDGDVNLLLHVEMSEKQIRLWPIIGSSLAALAAVLLFGLYCNNRFARRNDDKVWTVKLSDLEFADPPVILGRGSFGVVLVAEYRGTKVAVKRVLNGQSECAPVSKSMSGYHGNMSMSIGSGPAKSFRSKLSVNSVTSWLTLSHMNVSKSSASRLADDFKEEMRCLAKLRHPCITTIMGAVVKSSSEQMIVMEYMTIGSLNHMVQNDSIVLEGELLLPIFRDIAQGVRFLHSADPGIVHGDLKGSNILIDSNFRAKVADFGLTRSQEKSGDATGTPFWMAPELLRGEASNCPETDVYSFGMIMYEVYSQKNPYHGEDHRQIISLICDKSVKKRPAMPLSFPPAVSALAIDCLSEDPSSRPSFEELDAALKVLSSNDVHPIEDNEKHQMRSTQSASWVKQLRSGDRSEALLSELFPDHVCKAFQGNRRVDTEDCDNVTIIFAQINALAEGLTSKQEMKVIEFVHFHLRELCEKYNVFRVDTNSGAFLGAVNLFDDQPDHHVELAAQFCIDALDKTREVISEFDMSRAENSSLCKFGFHSGPVTAAVVGSRCPRYCLFGDAVKTAKHMAKTCVLNHIQCSGASANLLKDRLSTFELKRRGNIPLDGGSIESFWVEKTK